MRKLFIYIPVILVLFISGRFQDKTINVAVAANAQYAMKEVEAQFEKETGKNINLIIGSSGKLTAQIKEYAPFDIFLSADMEYPKVLFKENLTVGEPRVYGYGSLVLWTMKDIKNLNIKSILLPEVKTIAIANPKVAPYGEAAESTMKYYGFYEKAKARIVYGENISQVTQYVTTQAADLGFTAKSVVLSPEMAGKGKWIDIDPESYTPIDQAAVLLKSYEKRDKETATKFFNYIFSDKARKIFKKYGYRQVK
jgi:molybdate transport system substrate-binding protein